MAGWFRAYESHNDFSHVQPFARAHCSVSRCPLAAAPVHVKSSHGQSRARAHCSVGNCPPRAAAYYAVLPPVVSSIGVPLIFTVKMHQIETRVGKSFLGIPAKFATTRAKHVTTHVFILRRSKRSRCCQKAENPPSRVHVNYRGQNCIVQTCYRMPKYRMEYNLTIEWDTLQSIPFDR